MIISCLVYPISNLLILIKKKHRLSDPTFQIYFGCYLKGYKTKYFFWEFVIMSKKIIFISFTALIKNVFQRCAAMLCFITFFAWITLNSKPFIVTNMNYLEYYSNYCSLFFVMTIAFCTEKNEIFLQMVFLLLCFFVNSFFLLKWLFSVLQILFVKYQNICLNNCPCIYILFISYLKYSMKSKTKKSFCKSTQIHRKTPKDLLDDCLAPVARFLKILRKVKTQSNKITFKISLNNNMYEIEKQALRTKTFNKSRKDF